MSSVQPPQRNRPIDPYKYKVEETQERQNKEEFAKESGSQSVKRSAILSYLLLLFRKLLHLFEFSSRYGLSREEEKEIQHDLLQFKTALLLLGQKDHSQDLRFLHQLSHLWHALLNDSMRFRRKSTLALQFQDLIAEIQAYPPTQDHTLGYYLTECAGQRWLPFPYMEMMHLLHLHSQQTPTSSPIACWIAQIDAITEAISEK